METINLTQLLTLILGSGVVGTLITLFFTRRKTQAEARKIEGEAESTGVDADKKTADFLKEIRSENIDLIKKNTALEKTVETLTARLKLRDEQIETCNKQLEHLRSLAQQSPIIETLRVQLDAVNQMVNNLQAAQAEGQKVMAERERTLQEVLRTGRKRTSGE